MDSRPGSLTSLQTRFDRVQSTNKALIQDLSTTTKRLQRLAISLGFNDAYEAQAEIDASTSDLTYRSCFETVQAQQAEIKTLRDRLELAEKQNMAWKKSSKVFPLDADTTGYLLVFLPHLPSLLSTILSCKFLYQVFRTDRQSIVSAVVFNQIGPALPQALRLARAEISGPVQVDIRELPREDSVLSAKFSGKEAAILARNAEVVTELESLFSWKYKNRKSTTSVLTTLESERFGRALYRIMLLCFKYGLGSIAESQTIGDEYEYTEYEYADHSKQTDFLQEFPTSELYEIERVARFLRSLGKNRLLEDTRMVGVLDVYDFDGLLLFMGPRLLLQCYNYYDSFDRHFSYYDDGPASGFITVPLARILSERDTSTRPDFERIILDSIHGKDDICARCRHDNGFNTGVHLVNDTCWDGLKGTLREDVGSWSRRLMSNPTESKLRETLRDIDYRKFMDTLFDAKGGEYSDWVKDEWTCRSCLGSLWSDTLSVWWLQQKRDAGVPIKRNCWHGYMCGEQSKRKHAEAFNHICEPTRFDYHR